MLTLINFTTKDYSITKNELMDLNETLNLYKSSKAISLFDLIKAEENSNCNHITTMSSAFDSILDGNYCHYNNFRTKQALYYYY